MKLVQKNRIYFPQEWGDNELFFAFSQDGELIAVRHTCDNSYPSTQKNIFVYTVDGEKKWEHRSLDRGGRGVAFFPDKHHLLVPGADDSEKNLDGLKLYPIGNNTFKFPFANSSIHGVNTSVYGASNGGGYVLGYKEYGHLYCLSMSGETQLPGIRFTEAYFSPNVDAVVLHSISDGKSYFLRLSTPQAPIDFDGQFVCFLPDKKILIAKNVSSRTIFSILELETMQVTSQYDCERPEYIIDSGACSPDGNVIATCDINGSLDLWSKDLSHLSTLRLSNGQRVSRMQFSYDNRHLLAVIMNGYDRREVIVWNMQK